MKATAIIVTYNPDTVSLSGLINCLLPQTQKVIIVDNHSANLPQWQQDIQEKAMLIALDKNYGIAYAQNRGIAAAYDVESNKYIIFFDQDSAIDAGFVPTLEAGYEQELKEDPLLAAVGPALVDKRYGFFYPFTRFNPLGGRKKISAENRTKPFEVSTIIASGMLVHQDIFTRVGLMNESFFIDYVDIEWCLRAKSKGYHIKVIPAVTMQHAIGDAVIKVGRWRLPVHCPMRRYYIIRNAFYLFKLSHIPKMVALRQIIVGLIHQMALICVGDKKSENWSALWAAIRDGMRLKPTQ